MKVTPTGYRAYIVRKRFNSNATPSALTIAKFGDISLSAAQERTRSYVEAAQAHDHPRHAGETSW